jgi:ribonuclease D
MTLLPPAHAAADHPLLVYNQKALGQMLAHVGHQSVVAVDTESNSFYAYYPRVCLIQISTTADAHNPDPAQVVDYLVDPLRLESVEPLGKLLGDPNVEVVMHAAENDILMLRREFGFRFDRIFDTQLAARILGWQQVGLAAILEEHFGAVSDKRMQRTDWTTRPLSPQQIAYAQMDTHYLLSLRALLIDKLTEAGRMEEARDAFDSLVAQTDPADYAPQPRTFWQMKVTRSVALQDTGVLQAVWEWREREAQRLNRPPFKVLADEALTELAGRRPQTPADLAQVQRLNAHQARRYGAALLQAVQEGESRPRPPLPPPTPRPELLLSKEEYTRYERLRRWRTDTAARRGVAPEIVFNNEVLLAVAAAAPRSQADLAAVPGVSPWKARAYGEEVLEVVARR